MINKIISLKKALISVFLTIGLVLFAVFFYKNVVAQLNSADNKIERPIYAAALRAYGEKKYDLARELGLKSAKLEGKGDKDFLAFIYYWVARVDMIRGNKEQSIDNLEKAIGYGYGSQRESSGLAKDVKFKPLHNHPKWESLIKKSKNNFLMKTELDEESKSTKDDNDNLEVQALYKEDQHNLKVLQKAVKENSKSIKQLILDQFFANEKRLQKMKLLIEAEKLKTVNDFNAAATVLQHSEKIADIRLANKMAQKGHSLAKNDADKCKIGWIIAATTDRNLWYQGKPQIYGTQSRPLGNSLKESLEKSQKLDEQLRNKDTSSIDIENFTKQSPTTIEPIDRTKISNEERKKLCVPILKD